MVAYSSACGLYPRLAPLVPTCRTYRNYHEQYVDIRQVLAVISCDTLGDSRREPVLNQ